MTVKTYWLSHEFNEHTPAYRGGEGFVAVPDKQLCKGDGCNTVRLSFSNHLGTHVDLPYHFLAQGKKLSDYGPSEWLFKKVQLITVPVDQNEVISIKKIEKIAALQQAADVNLLLIKTGFEKFRYEPLYWECSPGFSPDLAAFLKEKIPSIQAIGFDAISLTGAQHRELGREAHKEFLSREIRIFEDMSLAQVNDQSLFTEVIALPLRFEQADGTPCSIVARIAEF